MYPRHHRPARPALPASRGLVEWLTVSSLPVKLSNMVPGPGRKHEDDGPLDEITIYRGSARRLHEMDVASDNSKALVDLPQTTIPSSLVVFRHDDGVSGNDDQTTMQLASHRWSTTTLSRAASSSSSRQLIVDMPSGVVVVEDEHGQQSQGELESIDGVNVTIKDLHHQGTKKLIHNYKKLVFLKRPPSTTRRLVLSYLLNGLTWKAQHTLVLDAETSTVVQFKTVAHVTNKTGLTFNLSSMRLSLNNPPILRDADSSDNGNHSGLEEQEEPPLRRAKVAAVMAPSFSRSINLQEVQTESLEDFRHIEVGPQFLQEAGGQYEILSLSDLALEKLYVYDVDLHNHARSKDYNSGTLLQFKMTVPDGQIVASGPVTTYGYDVDTRRLGSFLGTTSVDAPLVGGDDLVLSLGTSSIVRAKSEVRNVVKQASRKGKGNDDDDQDDVDEHPLTKLLGSPTAVSEEGQSVIVVKQEQQQQLEVPVIKTTFVECFFVNESDHQVPTVAAARFPYPQHGQVLRIDSPQGRASYQIKDQIYFTVDVPARSKARLSIVIAVQYENARFADAF